MYNKFPRGSTYAPEFKCTGTGSLCALRRSVRIVSRLGEPNGTASPRLRPRKKKPRSKWNVLFYKLGSPQAAQLMTIFK